MTVEQSTDASFDRPTDWKSIDWTSIEKQVRRLQVRIAKAVQARTAARCHYQRHWLEGLEPYDWKLSSTVLRGGRAGNSPLPLGI